MEGVLQEGALYGVLLELAREGSTGILTVQGEEEIIAFSLLAGEIVAADALNTTMEEALGSTPPWSKDELMLRPLHPEYVERLVEEEVVTPVPTY